jgi:glycosyltransferase involved in cell wall biosynthesis
MALSSDRPAVVVASAYWTLNGVNVFSVNLVRGLCRKGFDAHILLTEEQSSLVTVNDAPMPRPDDVSIVDLPVGRSASWGAHWGAMIRYLEDRAPCIYIPNFDWRHSCVTPLLSDAVRVVGVVHSDDPMHYDHVKRLGAYWDAVVTTSGTIAAKTIALAPGLRDRTQVIPIGVEIPDTLPPRHRRSGDPLRVIYPGSLRQQQKRVLDLPAIVAAAARDGLPLTLTIAGGGPDEDRLREECADLEERGLIDFLGMVEHSRLLMLLEEHDVFILTSEFEGMPNALLEAMGRGCVPLVTNVESAIPDLVRNGDNGYVVPIGDIDAFAARLRTLCADVVLWDRMSRGAYETVSAGPFRLQIMVDAYAKLGDRLLGDGHRSYRRPRGVLSHPPREIEGVALFPVDLPYEAPAVGRFLSRTPDYREFVDQLRQSTDPTVQALAPPPEDVEPRTWVNHDLLQRMEVIVASTAWIEAGVNDFAVEFVRRLAANGISTHILLTEEDTELIVRDEARTPRPPDIRFERLPVGREGSWGAHWGAMIRYLEERAPCIYIPNDDWRHSCVCPLLSDRVLVVGIVHDAGPLHRGHVSRLGQYWNAVVTHDASLGQQLASDPILAPRVAFIPYCPDGLADLTLDYLRVFDKAIGEVRTGTFRRPPPREIDAAGLFQVDLTYEARGVGRFPARTPDYREFVDQLSQSTDPGVRALAPPPEDVEPRTWVNHDLLRRMEVIVTSPAWIEGGVNDFAAELVRRLAALGISVHILLTEEDTDLVHRDQPRIPCPPDIRFERLPVTREESWGAHWGAMVRYLEDRGPCIYIPNDDWRHSCVCPLLSNSVLVVGIAHDAGPLHRDHVTRLGRYWNAIVTHDETLGRKLASDPPLAPRVAVLPYVLEDIGLDYLRVFDKVISELRAGAFRRPRGLLQPPPREVENIQIMPIDFAFQKEGVGLFPQLDPDYAQFEQHLGAALLARR